MDLLSVSFRSMADLEPEQEEFLELEGRSIVEKVEPSEKSRLISGDEESVDNGEKNSLKDLRTINLNEVAWHDTVDSCWIVIRDFVYDCTDFLKTHPGGSDVILEYAGRDATLAFIGTGHSSAAIHSLKRLLREAFHSLIRHHEIRHRVCDLSLRYVSHAFVIILHQLTFSPRSPR